MNAGVQLQSKNICFLWIYKSFSSAKNQVVDLVTFFPFFPIELTFQPDNEYFLQTRKYLRTRGKSAKFCHVLGNGIISGIKNVLMHQISGNLSDICEKCSPVGTTEMTITSCCFIKNIHCALSSEFQQLWKTGQPASTRHLHTHLFFSISTFV